MPGSEWMPRLNPGQSVPNTLEEWYELACSPVYADSGIQKHLACLSRYAGVSKHVVELGTGGGDQSTLALLIGNPKSLDCFDISPPGSLPTIERLADESGVAFEFHCEDTTKAEGIQSDLLLVDSLHTAAQVEAELAIFAPLCSKRIVFHDVISFGDHGQTDKPDQGINLAIARFLYKHPEWSVERYSEEDNGLLTLRRGCT